MRAVAEPDFVPVGGGALDPAAFAQWVDGEEIIIDEGAAKDGPYSVVWTKGKKPDWRGVKFGEGLAGGERHLRIGFKKSTKVGSVMVRGGGALSVLKPGASYPGDLGDDSQWMAAERLVDGRVSQKEVDREEYAIWVLPAGTKTKALRFSHSPSLSSPEMVGWLGGVWMHEERLGNVAPQALVRSSARDDVSAKLVDAQNGNDLDTWDNGEQGAELVVSPDDPEIVTLTWSKPVDLNGICLLWTGFSAVEVEAFTGNPEEVVREAADSRWRRVGSRSGMDALYPLPLGTNWIPFEKPVRTRAVRLRIIDSLKPQHDHLKHRVKDGRRVWLGELMAMTSLGDRDALTSIVLPKQSEEPPPIPIRFTLPEAGVVTLVIEDENNQRVRNLVSETPFPAGENTVWWDGSDDLLRDPEAAKHGVYHLPSRLVEPGDYQVRGLWHKPLKLHYEFSIYNAGKPAWDTADKTGGWLTTHTPPTSMAVVPGERTRDGKPLIFMGAFIAEGGHGLQWLDEDGTKLGGQHWVGGHWTGAPTLAVDLGKDANLEHLCYVGSVWEGELRLTAKTRDLNDAPVFKLKLGDDPSGNKLEASEVLRDFDGGDKMYVLGGIAAHDGMLVCSMVRQDELLVVDIKQGKITNKIKLVDPRGVRFDREGRLLALSGKKLVRFETLSSAPKAVITDGLSDPRHVVVYSNDYFLITDRADSHQVKVFSPSGKRVGVIGKPGVPDTGLYDPLHMNNPNGLAVDTQGKIWVAECDEHPRRVSVWTDKGKLFKAYYGPTEYGGGGVLDPQDKTRFFYNGMEFKLDWKTGTDKLVRVFHRPEPSLMAHYGPYSPDTPLYPAARKNSRYFTSCYTHSPTSGDDAVFIWEDAAKEAKLVAGFGKANSWSVLRQEEFLKYWPEGTRPHEEHPAREHSCAFSWTDANDDGVPQPKEVEFLKAYCSGVTVMNDLSVVVSRFNDRNVRFAAAFNHAGLPSYVITKPEDLGVAGGNPPSSGGNQSLTELGGWTIHTNASEPFSAYGLGGTFKGEARWSYPSVWPGLHASHEAAVPDRPGMMVGHTRLLGGWIQGKAGPMFCVNGNMGNMYLITADGMFVSTLFNDVRLRPKWAPPVAVRNMDVTDVSLHDENFWPSITQTSDGKVFLMNGGRSSLVRLDGLETLKRLPEQRITVTADSLELARNWFKQSEERRQQERGSGTLNVPFREEAPQVDGSLSDWPQNTDWADIDRRGVRANFDSDSRPYEVSAAVALSRTHLYAAWRTTEKGLLNNTGETPNAPFKHGGCLDLMLATDPSAEADRNAPVAGDQRLLITQVKGKTLALLYRAKVPGTKEPIAFSSPWRTIPIDVIEDVSEEVMLSTDKNGNYEISVPLSSLHWRPKLGESYRADIGILRGSNGQTTQRVYWTNKATAITADIPSEVELTPKLWGKWKVERR